jgi:hypothetical protein
MVDTMAQANSFSHIGAACVRVLARHAAINHVKSEIARQGLRLRSVPMRELHIQADEYLAAHPELVEQAAQRVAAQPERWLPKRALRSVSQTGSANPGTEKTQLFSTTSAIFSAW